MKPSSREQVVEAHIRDFFAGHEITNQQWTLGPVPEAMPDFKVLSVAPGNLTDCWTYLSVGASLIEHDDSGLLEFFIMSPFEDLRIVELVTMVTWYHKTHSLGVGHTLPIGEPWLPTSSCNHLLVSKPYPFGPELEICNLANNHIHLLWLLPITQSERDYKVANGLEALEQKFDDAQLDYSNITRQPVI